MQAGGWSHLRYQQHSEEIWAQTQGEVAEAVERLAREHAPRFVVIAGDVRARQLLRDQLGPALAGRVVEVDAHTRAAGADGGARDTAIAEAIDRALRADLDAVVDRASAGDAKAPAMSAVAAPATTRGPTSVVYGSKVTRASPLITASWAARWSAQCP